MRTLHEGFAKDPGRFYFPYKDRTRNTFKRTFLPGVTVYVLGPSRDPEVIRDMEPEDDETFKHLLESVPAEPASVICPFIRTGQYRRRDSIPSPNTLHSRRSK